ncbi:MAG: nuclear transport factor 2 family protein [Candidatus Afipia apatlaquensis]|uniref:Nuclear transport factor 2 family protein n=1 Tax=Candidatus Afipia apatlaquensis TaxID=2712852 RepID=A0A7C9VP39_9BRAD|nr:nuclear transport factor 2 family protein [Candidatus Afipia apatlaquensis]
MQALERTLEQRTAFADTWIGAWNSRDLDQVLALYADDSEMVSDKIIKLGLDPNGRLRGKDNLRVYWGRALPLRPKLHFTLINAFVSPDSLVVFYRDELGREICEYLRLNGDGKIVQGSANHIHG